MHLKQGVADAKIDEGVYQKQQDIVSLEFLLSQQFVTQKSEVESYEKDRYGWHGKAEMLGGGIV